MRKIIFLCLLVGSMWICNCYTPNVHKHNLRFIERFGKDNFDQFVGKTFFVRTFDHDGSPVVLVFPENSRGHYRITIDKTTKQKRYLYAFNSAPPLSLVEEESIIKLTLAFLQYKVCHLQVDSNLNVEVGTIMEERFPHRLKRFSDIKFKTEKYGSYVHIIDNWYEASP